MEKNIIQYKCYPHQQEMIAFDLDPLAEIKDKYLCLKCLAIQSPNRQIETIQDAQQKFMEMKIKEFINKEKQLTSNIEKLFKIQKQIKEFFEFFVNQITESQKILKSRIQEEQNELNRLIQPQQGMQTEKDLLDLTNYENYGFSYNNNQINPKQYEFINQIQQLLDYQIFEEQLQNISISLQSIQTKKSLEKQVKLIPLKEQLVYQNKLISLRYLCQNHQSRITMISLEPRQIEQRLFCQICIQGKKLNGLNSLYEVNKKWQTYLQNVYISNNNFHNKRQNNQLKINEFVNKYQKFHSEFFKVLNKLMINQNNKIIQQTNESQVFNQNKQLYQMELKEINQVIQTLMQQDQMSDVLKKQNQVVKEDKYNYDQICEQFNQLEKKLSETQLEISKLFFMNDQIEGQIKLKEANQSFNKQSSCQLEVQNESFYKQTIDQQNKELFNQTNKLKPPCTNLKRQYSSGPIVQQYHIQKFSTHLKHHLIDLSSNNNIATNTNSTYNVFKPYAVCLCYKPIPQQGSHTVNFKVNRFQNIVIGICKRLITVNQNFEFLDRGNTGHGFYVMSNESCIYSHDYSSRIVKQFGFKFQEGDIINVEVNQSTKQIIWRNKTNKKFVLEFEPQEDLHFCCGFFLPAQVEIV